ncbi:hypothetical protein MCP1_560015 [Candidatus Terasakiella magnetica]|nr:hypothetical protein MCP1_560015 [Candidatus Terasakiella magnetica]
MAGVRLGVTEVRQDLCHKTLSSYAAVVYCPFPGGRLDAGKEGELTCSVPARLLVGIVGTVCIVGFQSSWISVDTLVGQFTP